jgi:2-(1,2-epoxy-1,2-dihydrophenyl)acetyl-CoA isomerase
VEGAAAGGGLALALCAGLIVVAAGAKLAFTFDRIGLVPDWGVLHTLPRRVGWAEARSILLQGRVLGAEEARVAGLADALTAKGEAEAEALAMLRRMAAQAPAAFAATKRILRAAPTTLDDALEMELLAQASLFQGPAFREGVAAFFEKRPPRF